MHLCKVLPHLSKGQLSKETLVQGDKVQGTVVQGDFGPGRLLSKKAFTSDRLAQIIFFIFYYKSLLGLMSLGLSGPWTTFPWTTVPWTNVSTPFLTTTF